MGSASPANKRLQRTRLRAGLLGGHAFGDHRGIRWPCHSSGAPLSRNVGLPLWAGTALLSVLKGDFVVCKQSLKALVIIASMSFLSTALTTADEN